MDPLLVVTLGVQAPGHLTRVPRRVVDLGLHAGGEARLRLRQQQALKSPLPGEHNHAAVQEHLLILVDVLVFEHVELTCSRCDV